MAESATYNHNPNEETDGKTDDPTAGSTDSTATGSETNGGDLIAGEFKTQEDLVNAYLALKSGSKDGASEDGDTKDDSSGETDGDGTETDQATEELEKRGLQMGDFESEFALNGELSDESYQKLEDAGIPKSMVDAYIDAVSSKAESMKQEVFDSVGGEESYMAMVQWAASSLPEAEVNAFNKVVSGNDFEAAKIAIAGLNSKYGKATGAQGRMIQGKQTTSVGDVFKSNQEVVAAMKDPRYKTDRAYQEEVRQKLGRSNVLI
jgi:hypothetical protein